MEQNRRPRQKFIPLQPTDMTKATKIHDGEMTASSTNVSWKTGYPHARD
jgi:hypothetical protein